MKYVLVLLCLIQVFYSHEQVNSTDDQGRKQGEWVKFWKSSDNTAVQYKGHFIDDQPVGQFWHYYPTGEVRAIIEHVSPDQSYVTYYFRNKEVMSEGMYKDQKRDSIWINYNNIGLTISLEKYKEGKLEGNKVLFYLQDQLERGEILVLSESYYKDSLKSGPYREYFSSGKLKQKGQYINGNSTGEWLRYSAIGYMDQSVRYKYGEKHGWSVHYNEKGEIVNRSLYVDGIVLKGKEKEAYLKMCKKKGIDPND